MCGRFTLMIPDYESVAELLGVVPDAQMGAAYRPRYNLPPMDPHVILRIRHGVRELLPANWGLIPHWAKGPENAAKHINARAEGIQKRPAFRDGFSKRRCIIPADGFYEWVGAGKNKTPVWFHPPPDEGDPDRSRLLLFAGVYERWQDPKTETLRRTFTIITTQANDTVRFAHDRMPVILTEQDAERWLNDAPREVHQALLKPAADEALVARPVCNRANSVKNDDPSCLDPFEDGPKPGENLRLF